MQQCERPHDDFEVVPVEGKALNRIEGIQMTLANECPSLVVRREVLAKEVAVVEGRGEAHQSEEPEEDDARADRPEKVPSLIQGRWLRKCPAVRTRRPKLVSAETSGTRCHFSSRSSRSISSGEGGATSGPALLSGGQHHAPAEGSLPNIIGSVMSNEGGIVHRKGSAVGWNPGQYLTSKGCGADARSADTLVSREMESPGSLTA